MGKLFLTYNNDEIQDGFFAQVQRVFAIYSISQNFNLKYYHSKIKNITVTQLDVMQTEDQISNFLDKANQIFQNFKVNELPKNVEIIYLSQIKIKDLFKYFAITKVLNKNILLKITNPYGIIERIPNAYKHAVSATQLPILNDYKNEILIVSHIRRGVTLGHILPGENRPRALNEDYYLKTLKKISNQLSNSSAKRYIILTDAPEENYLYKPPKKDLHKWEEFKDRKFDDQISIDGHEFANIKFEFSEKLEVIRGGDLIKCLKLMIDADYLIMSRSSMSYVGALLNKKGIVIYPPDFWHKSMKNWIKNN